MIECSNKLFLSLVSSLSVLFHVSHIDSMYVGLQSEGGSPCRLRGRNLKLFTLFGTRLRAST